MELANSYLEEGFPFRGRKRKKMEQFLEKSGLTYDAQIIYSVLLCRGDGEIIGCGSRHENILKCIAAVFILVLLGSHPRTAPVRVSLPTVFPCKDRKSTRLNSSHT